MANLDTREKRASGWNINGPIIQNLPLPDSSITAPDREQTSYSYAGIAADNPVTPPAGTGEIITIRRRRR